MKPLALILGLLTLSTPTFATPITFTGAELANLPGASFPTGGQSIVGDDLRIDPTAENAVLYRLDLSQFIVDPTNISISVNSTRLLRDDNFEDQELRIGLYDGQTFFHTTFVDFTDQTVEPRIGYSAISNDETLLGRVFIVGSGSNVPSPINSIARLSVTIQAGPTATVVEGEVNGAGGFASEIPTVLDINNGLSLILAGNELGENYLLTSLTFTSDVSLPASVPEPNMLGGLALALTTLGFGLHRRRLQ